MLPYLIPWHKALQTSATAHQWTLSGLSVALLWNRKVQYKGLATWAAICYFLACVLSTVTALDPWVSVFGLFGTHRAGLIQTATVLLAFHLAKKSDEEPLRGSLILFGAWCGLLCISQTVAVAYFGREAAFDGRAWGLLGSPVFSGAMLAACIAATGIPKPWELGRQICLGLMLIGLFLCGSRGAWVAFGVGISVYYLPKKCVLALFAATLLALTAYIWRPTAGPKEVGRQLAAELAFKGIKKRPIQGIGGDQFAFLYLSMPPSSLRSGESITPSTSKTIPTTAS